MKPSKPQEPAIAKNALKQSQITRRDLFRRGAMTGGMMGGMAGGLVAGLGALPSSLSAATLPGFAYGVASGEPGANRVLLWTRYQSGHDASIRWELSESPEFTAILAGGSAQASAENDFCVKVWAEGLEPDRWYFYRFIAEDGTISDIGRTRTLPQGRAEKFRMAVVGCANIGFGYFNAYAHIAEADDIDLVLHSGDYIYEYQPGIYPRRAVANPDRTFEPASEIVTLTDYRLRYASYRRDPDLQRLHQMFPMIHVNDDHESADNAYVDGAVNHDPATQGDWGTRKIAVARAMKEWLPISGAPWASYDIGDLASLFRLETRLTARSKQFNLTDIFRRGGGDEDKALAAFKKFKEEQWRDPTRTLMGAQQQQWLAEGLKTSRRAGTIWQVLLQQVIMAQLNTPVHILEGMSDKLPGFLREQVQASAIGRRAGLPFNMDAWDGYPVARENLLSNAQEAEANLIVLAGDSHNAWASELSNNGAAAGVEFAGNSVTSPGAESFIFWKSPQDFARNMVEGSPQLQWADTSQRGYMHIELGRDQASSEYRFMAGIKGRSTQLSGTKRHTTQLGSHTFQVE